MYIWGAAKLNGTQYDPQNKELVKFLMSLVADCATYPADQEQLRKEGHLVYDYQKTEAKRTETTEQADMVFTKTAECNAE
eukprot:7223909-Lingulodinium_polyedra.AAC.1